LFRGAGTVYARWVSASRVVMGVAKVGVFCCVVFVGVVVFRGTSLSTRLSETWAMRNCTDLLQADLNVLLMTKKPKVLSCVGPATRAVCQVETTEAKGGQENVKTAPLGRWDCTRRHVPDGYVGTLMKLVMDGRAAGQNTQMNPVLLKLAGATPQDTKLFDEIDAVASVLNARQTTIDTQ
jgi:hypothetical protein